MAEIDWSRYTKPLPVRITGDVREDLRRVASARGMTVSAFVRKAIGEAIEAELADSPIEELAGSAGPG